MYAKLYIEFREQNNLYQYQLAEMLDVSVPYMSRLERGEAKPSQAPLFVKKQFICYQMLPTNLTSLHWTAIYAVIF